jgi:hypothetical protein
MNAGVIVSAFLLAAGLATAAPTRSRLTDLGRPTSALPSANNPAGEFRHITTSLRSHSLPELLFIGNPAEADSAAERWPLVKALDQFGAQSGVEGTSAGYCIWTSPVNAAPITVNCVDPNKYHGIATFDFSHARYQSAYLAFVAKDLIDRQRNVHQNLSSTEKALFDRYARAPGYPRWSDAL